MQMNRAVFSSKNGVFHLLRRQNQNQMLQPSVICKSTEAENLQNINYQMQLLRAIHVTKGDRDLESGLRALGSGVAATGVIGSGIGIGIIFGNLLSGTARNPSVGKNLMTPAILGMCFCESLALFALIIAFIIQP